MLFAIADRGNVWLLNISDNLDIGLKDLEKEWYKRYLGWIINGVGSRDLLLQMPIHRFALKPVNGDMYEISHEQAALLFQLCEESAINKLQDGAKKQF